MKLPAWLVGLLLLGWTIWSTKLYWCDKCGCCGTPAATTLTTGTITNPLLFKWNSDKALMSAQFTDFQANILRGGELADTLVVTGLYRKGETNNTAFANLGLARAEAVKQQFLAKMPAARIRTAAKMVDDGLAVDGMNQSCTFDWLKAKLNLQEASIIEGATGIVSILFPYNSSIRDNNDKVDTYLKSLAAKEKSTTTNITITGHTDDRGEAVYNQSLGQRRADAIKAMLVSYGMAATRIKTDSKGESQPVTTNATEEGKHQNRRVVIEVK
jgi:outer membrane protein OmpA-like peptidoglycan-associated protein